MKRGTAVAAVVTVFVVGLLVGALGMFFYCTSHRLHDIDRLGSRLMVAELERRLGLQPEQKAKIEVILEDARHDVLGLRQDMHRQVVALLNKTHARLLLVLTPEQRQEFERLHSSRDPGLRHLLHHPPEH